MKRLFSLTLIAVMMGLAITSCKDDFNEEEFLRLQSELKLKQDEVIRQRIDSASEDAVKEYIAAANEAGDLLAVSLVVRENGNALEGVTVTLSSGTANEISSGRAKATTSGVTDASGMVVFDRVTIGSGTASFSKEGYVSATATYEFGTPGQPIQIQTTVPNSGTVTRYAPPLKRFEEAAISMISATPSSGSTATISGKVTIENDLTNLTPEVPTGIVLRANLTALLGQTQGFFTSYTLADNSTLGRATIANDGTYTMVVPATATGTTINFIVPNIEGACRMAVNGYDNGTGTAVPLPTPEYRAIPTVWGSNVAETTVPEVIGARVVVPAAPAAGTGLSFEFTPVGRSLITGTISGSTPTNFNILNNNVFYRIANRGSFSNPATPTVTISGGGGQGATATAKLQTLIKAIQVTNPGEGYGAQVTLRFRVLLENDNFDNLGTVVINTVDGKLPQYLNLEFIDADGFGTDDAAIEVPEDAIGLALVITDASTTAAELTPTFVTDLKSIKIDEPGMGYTSAPTITVNGGTGTAVEVVQLPVFWDINPVMGPGTDYAIIPEFTIHYPQSHSQNGSTSSNIDSYHQNGNLDDDNVALREQLTISAGDIIKKFPRGFRTIIQSHGKPSMTIKTIEPKDAKFSFIANSISETTGAITAEPTATAGAGYNSKITAQIVPSIEGAPGSGAILEFTYDPNNYTEASGEWTFVPSGLNTTTMTITNPGSGYLKNLNQREQESEDLPTSLQSVQAGKTYVLNFKYGTGGRSVDVD
jgi:hypothetical protein